VICENSSALGEEEKPMTANRFGGGWTKDKLDVLREYLTFYCVAMSKQRWNLVYIDAFAGTGRCAINVDGTEQMIDGSAKIALDLSPGFDALRFIEKKKTHRAELQALIATHPFGQRARIAPRAAEDVLPMLLLGYDWASHRGVLFLDPFGLQCTYKMLQQIAATKALDVFFLVSLSGLYRQAARNESRVDAGKAAKLTAFLGTDGWRDAIYKQPTQGDMFEDQPSRERERGADALLQFTTTRLRLVFPYVGDPNLMLGPNGAPIFALYFAVSNPSKAALDLAKKVSVQILSKLKR
jgi:three-Cys-motif partner protein